MNQAECDYWDEHAKRDPGKMRDNMWKRQHIVSRLLRDDWVDTRTLEIGVGFAQAAAAINVCILGRWKYIGTDVSKIFCEQAKTSFGLDVRNTDILALPSIPDGYTHVIALDSLEHVNPTERSDGYAILSTVMAKHARLYIHYSLGLSVHDKRFDHPFGGGDLMSIKALAGLRMVTYEEYVCWNPAGDIPYVWVVMQR